MQFLGIDLGTSSIKGAILDVETNVVGACCQVPFPGPIAGLPPLFHEVDGERVISATEDVIAKLLAEARECSGILMCGQMGGLISTNDKSDALSNYISWQDKRLMQPQNSNSRSYFDRLLSNLTPDDWSDLGREVRPGLPMSLLFWLTELRRLPAAGTIAASLPDFVAGHFCRREPGMHPTGAVGSLNVCTGDWHHQLFSRLGFAQIRWPRLIDFREPIGVYGTGTAALPVYAPVGDHQCSLLGAELGTRELSVNISTGSQVSMLTASPEEGDYQVRPYFDGTWLKTITNLPAGRALNVFMRLLTEMPGPGGEQECNGWRYVAKTTAAITETDLKMNLAFFPTPIGDRGEISNIREDNFTVGHLFRAAFQNMAETYYTSALRLSGEQSWQSLLFSGGLSQKLETLRTVIAQRFARDYRLCPATEESLEGLLRLASVIAGKAEMNSLFPGP